MLDFPAQILADSIGLPIYESFQDLQLQPASTPNDRGTQGANPIQGLGGAIDLQGDKDALQALIPGSCLDHAAAAPNDDRAYFGIFVNISVLELGIRSLRSFRHHRVGFLCTIDHRSHRRFALEREPHKQSPRAEVRFCGLRGGDSSN